VLPRSSIVAGVAVVCRGEEDRRGGVRRAGFERRERARVLDGDRDVDRLVVGGIVGVVVVAQRRQRRRVDVARADVGAQRLSHSVVGAAGDGQRRHADAGGEQAPANHRPHAHGR